MIVIEPTQLRSAAETMARTAEELVGIGSLLPSDVPVPWLSVRAAEVLGEAAAAMSAWREDLGADAAQLQTRADEVDAAEQRVWTLPGGAVCCVCTLPNGEVVAVTSASSASGGAEDPGGSSSGPGVTVVNPGSGGVTNPEFTLVPGGSAGLDTPIDAQIDAGADKMTADIMHAMGGGGGSGAPGMSGGPTIIGAMNTGPASIPGDGNHIYRQPSGNPIAAPPSQYSGQTPMDLGTGGAPKSS